MKPISYLAGLAVAAIGIPVAFSPIHAEQSALVHFCPDYGYAPRCAAAAELFLSSDPSDTLIIDTINALAERAKKRRPIGRSCIDFRTGLLALGNSIDDVGSRTLVAALASSLCHPPLADTPRSLLDGDTGNANRHIGASSGGSSSGASGSSGMLSSGASGSSGKRRGHIRPAFDRSWRAGLSGPAGANLGR